MEIDIIRTNLKYMLEMRGDDVSYIEEHGDAVVYDDVQRFYKELIILDTDKTTIFFALTKDILKEKLLVKEMKKEDTAEAIFAKYKTKNFIVVTTESPSIKQSILQLQLIDKVLQDAGGMLQIFNVDELKYNPLTHRLVPKHRLISEAEEKVVMEKYKLKSKSQFPVISKSDIIGRWLGVRHGNVIEIERINNNSGEYYYYRCAV